jgi:endogenous inhibitor of DNA gyrase (YacG/DUF329 family)
MISGGCLVCGRTYERRPAPEGTAPFCSTRCQTIDLGDWLGGAYRLPADSDEGDGEHLLPVDDA